jgi:hypothetical protein
MRLTKKDVSVKVILYFTKGDITQMRKLEGPWDVQTKQFIPSTLPLPKLTRLVIQNLVPLDKPRKQTAKKRKTQQN